MPRKEKTNFVKIDAFVAKLQLKIEGQFEKNSRFQENYLSLRCHLRMTAKDEFDI